MTQEDWDAAIDARGDYVTWAAYCDWLQERGDPLWEPLALLNEGVVSKVWRAAIVRSASRIPLVSTLEWGWRQWWVASARVYLLADDATRREYTAIRTPVELAAAS